MSAYLQISWTRYLVKLQGPHTAAAITVQKRIVSPAWPWPISFCSLDVPWPSSIIFNTSINAPCYQLLTLLPIFYPCGTVTLSFLLLVFQPLLLSDNKITFNWMYFNLIPKLLCIYREINPSEIHIQFSYSMRKWKWILLISSYGLLKYRSIK